jgi:hypothetical protein
MATKKDKDITRSDKMTAVVDTISKAFEPSQILEKPIAGGKKAKYVKSQWYIARLNEAFGLAWSLEIFNHWMVNNHVVMHVRIHYPNPDFPDNATCREFKDGIASHPLSADVGNTFKAAYSKAFTIAASKVGSGLQLWGVETNADDVDESPTWDNFNAGGTPVTTVSPGPQNPASIPGMPPVPTYQNATPPGPPVPPVTSPPPPPPQFANSGATAPPPVPQAAGNPLPPPPVPVGNPGAAAVGTVPVGPDGQPMGPAVAAVGIQSAPAAGGIEDFQVNGILGAAVTRGMDPLQLVASVLGSTGITAIEQLSAEQAQKVLDAVRQMPPQ